MPLPQAASLAVFPFGATGSGNPVAGNRVLRFKTDVPGKYAFRFSSPEADTITASIRVSADDTTYNATTSGNNLVAVTNVSIPPKTNKVYEVLLRADTDKYVDVIATGGKGELQIDPSSGLIQIL